MSDKEQLRAVYTEIRKSLTEKEEKDSSILNTLKSYDIYNDCKTVFVYISSDLEVDTLKLTELSLKKGKTVAAPLCDTDHCTMDFYAFKSMGDLVEGSYKGILEPDAQKCERAIADENTVCIVPGLSYDKNGYRLGFGKGYYDRFLHDFPGKTIGLCYEDCICGSMIHDEYDVKISTVITEKRTILCDKENSDGR